jgi:hypothetical protein
MMGAIVGAGLLGGMRCPHAMKGPALTVMKSLTHAISAFAPSELFQVDTAL